MPRWSSRGTKRSALSAVCFGNFCILGHREERSDLLSFIASQRPAVLFGARIIAYAIVEVNFFLLIKPSSLMPRWSSRGTKRSALSAVCFGNFCILGHREERSDLLSFIASQRPAVLFGARIIAYAIVEVNFFLLIKPLYYFLILFQGYFEALFLKASNPHLSQSANSCASGV